MKELTGNHEGRLPSEHSGQTIVVFALVLVVIVGCLGLAVDIGRLYLSQEELTMKADAASLAGTQDLPTTSAAKADATNCYNAFVAGGSITTVSPGTSPCDGINTGDANTTFYAIDGNCVAVTTPFQDTYTQAQGYSSARVIKARAYTSFRYMIGSLFGFGSKKLYATSVSLQKSSVTAVHSLSTAVTNRAVEVNSGANVTITGGVQVNSTHPTAALYTAGALTASSTIKVVGGASGAVPPTPTPQTGQPSVADPFSALAAPAVPGTSYGGFTWPGGSTTMNPGRYTGTVTINGGTVTMNPGTYYFDNVDFRVNGGTVNGSEVFLFFAGNSSDVVLGGAATVLNLSPPTSGTYDGVLIYKRRTDTNGEVQLTGRSLASSISGGIYSANRPVTINPSTPGTLANTQVVADTITFGGSPTIEGANIAGGGGGALQQGKLIQ